MKYDGGDDVIFFVILIDLYVKFGRFDIVRCVFDLMLVKNVICFIFLILGYLNNGRVEDVEVFFKEIVEKDGVVFNVMIEGYSKLLDIVKKLVEVYIDM